MTFQKKTFWCFLFFSFYQNIESSDAYVEEYLNQYTNEEEPSPVIEQTSALTDSSNSLLDKTPLPSSTKLTPAQTIKNLQENNDKLRKNIAQRQADLDDQNKSKKEQKQNPALASKIKNHKIAIEKYRKQIAYNNEQIIILQKTNQEPSHLLGKLHTKKNKKRKPYCNPKITL